ncbi:MAG: hypothetical protein HWN71_10315 [Desulfobacterales bacterium]|nr:hypothetical protein [Desulfobacterales bacterium]
MNEPAETAKKWLTAMNEHDVDLMSSLCWEDDVGDEAAGPRQDTQNHRIL